VRALATWALTVVLLVVVLRSVPLDRTWEAVKGGGAAVVLTIFVYFGYSFVADSLATWATFRWFCTPLALGDVFAIRGATYLLAALNYNLGQGGIVYMAGRRPGVGIRRALGTVLLTMGVTLLVLLFLAAVGGLAAGVGDARLRLVRGIALAGLGAFAGYLVLIAVRPRPLAERGVLRPLFEAGLGGHLKAALVRLPHVAGHILFQWLILRLFEVDVPLGAAAALLPALLVIAWLPITVQGLGTQQLAAMELLGPYVHAATSDEQRARVVAFSLSVTLLTVLFSLLCGLLFVRRVAHELAAEPTPG
jgi:hypothetical protein